MREFDAIIVGLGLAGCCMVRRLQQMGKSVYVIDANEESTSSKIAAGLVNPVTGRRFVLSWNFEEFNQEAKSFYSAWQEDTQERIIYEMPIIRGVEDYRFVNDIEAKTTDAFYRNYIESVNEFPTHYLKPAEINYKINGSYRVDVRAILRQTTNQLKVDELIRFEKMEYDAIRFESKMVVYKNVTAKNIIFCEGASARWNPWFKHLPYKPTKGEIFELKHEHLLNFAYKNGLILLPKHDENILWCGSLSFWEFDNAHPSEEGEMILLQKLRKVYKDPVYIHRHLAAIRPTIRDRKPLIGMHPQFDQLAIFNGLGTKGALLAPWLSSHLVTHLYKGGPLWHDVSIHRFDS